MYGPPSGLIKENRTSIIKLMKSQNISNNSLDGIDKINEIKTKNITNKSYITKKNNPEEYNKKITEYILFHQNYQNNNESRNYNKPKTPKKPLLIPKQGSIQLKEGHYLRNNFIQYGKNNNIKNYVSPSFDYNIKNNHKSKDKKLSLKNKNPNPIKLQDSELDNAYKNRKTKKSNLFVNSSIDVKASSSSINEMDSLINKMRKNNIINKKNSEIKNKYNVNYNTNYNPEIRKYISYTPEPVKKAPFIKNKVSTSNDFEDIRRKEEIKMIFEREFKRKMNSQKLKKNKNSSNSSLMTKYSRNNKTEENKNLKNSQSQKNINNKNIINNKKEFRTINSYKRNTNTNMENNSNFTYEKYHLLLEQKITKLNNEIENLKNEEINLQKQLINYKEKEKECNDIRKLREEIEKYKIIYEKSTKACEEYSLEIQKIKNIIGENNINNNEELNGNNYTNSEEEM